MTVFAPHEALKAHAAGDLDPLAVDPAIFLGKQRGDHLAAVIRLTDAAKRCHLRNALVDFGIIADHPPLKSVALAPGATVLRSVAV